MSAPLSLPVEVDDLTADWFSEVFDRDVTEAIVLDRSTGTTGRARVELRGAPQVPASVFVKLPPFGEQQRELVDMTGMGVTEARFYRDRRGEIFGADAGRVVRRDRRRRVRNGARGSRRAGCRFPSSDDADIEARARDIVEQLAILHASFWESDAIRHRR